MDFNKQKVRELNAFATESSNFAVANLQKVRDVIFLIGKEGMKIKKRWIILMAAMTLIAVAGLCVGEPTFECDWSVISAADVAWLITATIFVLMMTPGLSFFYGGMVGAKNVISTMPSTCSPHTAQAVSSVRC